MFRVLVLVGALAAGAVAAWLSVGMQPNVAPASTLAAPEQQLRMEEVLVAAADLSQGTKLTGDELRWESWPEDNVRPGFILRSARSNAVEEFTGFVVRQTILDGEPIRDAKLAEMGAGYLAAVLKPGMRAVAVRVSVESSAGGFILPNDHVDVLHTSGDSGGRSLTILTNIRVLAIDQSAAQSETASAIGKTATLELAPAQAEIISGAQATGALSLALRATADNEEEGLAFEQRGPGVTVRMVRSGRSQTIQTDGPVR